MHKELKKLWTEALRSGRYNQATSVLFQQNDKSHCCLGVLADVHLRELGHTVDSMTDGEYMDLMLKQSYGELGFVLSEDFRYFTGITLHEQVELTDMNDEGKSFAEIADYIEEKL